MVWGIGCEFDCEGVGVREICSLLDECGTLGALGGRWNEVEIERPEVVQSIFCRRGAVTPHENAGYFSPLDGGYHDLIV